MSWKAGSRAFLITEKQMAYASIQSYYFPLSRANVEEIQDPPPPSSKQNSWLFKDEGGQKLPIQVS